MDQYRAGRFPRVNGIYYEPDDDRWSVLLFGLALAMKCLRSVSLIEVIKKFASSSNRPAYFIEIYLLLFWTISIALLSTFGDVIPGWIIIFACSLTIAQIVQTNLYHELFRPSHIAVTGGDTNISHNRLRSLILGVLNYAYTCFLFGAIYWKLSSTFNSPTREGLLDYVYFSYTVAWAVGSRNISPETVSWQIEVTVMCQIVVTLLLFGIILATAVGSVRIAGERSRENLKFPRKI